MIFDKYESKGAYHYDWYKYSNPSWYEKAVDRCVDFCRGSTLDAGCGDGVVANIIGIRGYDVLGIDDNALAIKLANEMNTTSNAKFKVHDLNKPISGKWEYMVCLNVIEHLEHPEAIKRIFNRNITKGLILITDVPQEHPSTYHVHEFTMYELRQMFHTRYVTGFKIDDNFHGVEVRK